jgi:hypothetical protein
LIRKITPNGTVSTISSATSPQFIKVDSFGNLVFTLGFRIQMASRCVYNAYSSPFSFSSGFLGTTRTIVFGNPDQCKAVSLETTTACCYITSPWSSYTPCSTIGTSTRNRKGTSS